MQDRQVNEERPNSGRMKAVRYRCYGGPERLHVEDTRRPEPLDGEVLVRIHASTVNRTDCGFLRGKPWVVRAFSGLFTPNSMTLGCEFAGEIVKVGRGVARFAVGDRVFAFKDDDHGFGGHAEFTSMPTTGMIAQVPQHMSYREAAPGLEGAHYALHYIRAARIERGAAVLVNGATGAIGSAAVQILAHLGAKVTAVCAGEHRDCVHDLGASTVIDYRQQDFTTLTDTFDVVFDAVGKSTWFTCRQLLGRDGIYLSTELGPYCQNPLLALFFRIRGSNRVLFPLPTNCTEDAVYLASLMQRGAYRPLIDRDYSLDDIVGAFEYVETGMKTGNVVINILPEVSA